jgi:hypothetical protein
MKEDISKLNSGLYPWQRLRAWLGTDYVVINLVNYSKYTFKIRAVRWLGHEAFVSLGIDEPTIRLMPGGKSKL